MSIDFGIEPSGGRDVVMRSLSDIADAKGSLTARGGRQQISKPIQVFSIELEDLLKNQTMSVAKATGWMYVMTTENEPVQIVELHSREHSSSPQFGHIEADDSVDRVLNTIRYAETRDEVMTTEYVLRELRIPSLCFKSIWLSAENYEVDLFIPITEVQPYFTVDTTYTVDEVFSKINKMNGVMNQGGFAPEIDEP